MELSRRMIPSILLCLLLLTATGMGHTMVEEGRIRDCWRNVGSPCLGDYLCGLFCQHRGFPGGGRCGLYGRNCFCRC